MPVGEIALGGLAGEEGLAALATAGEILSGPVGWGILLVGAALAAAALYNAHQKAQDQLKDSAQDQPCADCGEVGCFNTPEGGDPDEMDRQLKLQQDAINSKSPDEILDNLNKFDKEGRPDDAAVRTGTRQEAWDRANEAAVKQARRAGKSQAEAEAAGNAAGDAAVEGKDALHALDWVAGGDGTMAGMGDGKINKSIGSQWIHKAPGSANQRREDLRKAAEAAKKAGKPKMDVEIKKC